MSDFDELKKLIELFSTCNCQRTVVGLTSDVAFTIHGRFESVYSNAFKLVVLDNSEASAQSVPSQDDIFVYAQAWVINNAKRSAKEARDVITKKLEEKYGNLGVFINVFVGGEQSLWTSFNGEKRFAKFLLADNDKYGHDVLIVIK